MARIYGNVGELVGNTPLMELGNLARKEGLKARILAKLEAVQVYLHAVPRRPGHELLQKEVLHRRHAKHGVALVKNTKRHLRPPSQRSAPEAHKAIFYHSTGRGPGTDGNFVRLLRRAAQRPACPGAGAHIGLHKDGRSKKGEGLHERGSAMGQGPL